MPGFVEDGEVKQLPRPQNTVKKQIMLGDI